ncbi:gliding motility-associated C-terminal domain-containing protein [Crocinitomicaceae bacterium]|nr:gliding motility-associated C-terminal domain-containing protein [Crocinitomicaceae bacterium]
MKSSFLLIVLSLLSSFTVLSQCPNPTTVFLEDFEGAGTIPGAVTSNIYGGGSWTNAAYTLSGSQHGWFNVINGLSNVDVYDRQINGFCVGEQVDVSFWTRQSFGVTNVTFTVFDDANNIMGTTTLNLTNAFQQITYTFIATTPGLRFNIFCNSMGGSGVDIVVEDILMTQCISDPTENTSYTDCSNPNPVDLLTLFSAAMPTGGTWSGPSTLANGDIGTFDPQVNSNGIYSYEIVNSCGTYTSTVAINIVQDIDLGNDTTVCSGSWVILDAGLGFDSYLWSNGSTNQTITATTAGTYWVEAGTLLGNIVQNGDFEGGTTAASNNFTSGYATGTGGTWGLLSNPGQYAISTSPSLTHNNFAFCTDHTTGTGNMLVANGSSVAGVTVWTQTVPVTPGTDYLFSFWATNVVNDPNISNLQLYINGAPIGPINATTPLACNWLQINDVWNSGGATSAILAIINQSTATGGNDFAIDDIHFAPLCIIDDTIVITHETPNQTVQLVDPTCQAGTDGEIHIMNSLGVDYSIDNGVTWQTDSFFVNLPAGNYTVCSRSLLGCEICENVTITDPTPVTVSLTPNVTICENGQTTITATGSGGTTFDYHWDFTTSLLNSQIVSPNVNTTYSVYAENEFGCISPTISVDVSVNPPISGNIALPATICPGFSSSIDASALGGDGGPYTFTWSTGQVNTSAGTDVINVSPLVTTTYTVTITDGCESTPLILTTDVIVAPVPEPSYLILNEDQCEPGIFEITNTTDPNLSASIVWVVNGDEVFIDQETIITQSYNAGSYDLEMTVTSVDGCVTTTLFDDVLTVAPSPTAGFTFSPSPPTMFNTHVLFNNSSLNATTYQWYFEEGSPASSTTENPTTIFPDGQIGTYDVMLIATSDLGCMDTAILEVQVYPEVILYAPNTFTPDGDEFNQTWEVFIEGVDIYDFELSIFNRWGQVVWQNNDPNQGWDGNFNGKPVQDGTYTWFITTRDLLNDAKYEFQGHVNVIR